MEDLEVAFQQAYQRASEFQDALPPDTMLKLYAYYKQATLGDNNSPQPNSDLRNGFKLNAWMQLRGMSVSEAKKKYIELVHLL